MACFLSPLPPMKHTHSLPLSAALILILLGLCPLGASAITLLHVDDFESETAEGWGGGTGGTGSGAPQVFTTGGPGGAGDAYLGLPGTDAYLGSFNQSAAWLGNYTDAGVSFLNFDVANFGPDPVELRILLLGFGFSELHTWTSTVAVTVAPTGTWSRQSLEISGSAMTRFGNGTETEGFELLNVQKILIRHDPGPATGMGENPGGEVTTFLGLDNLTADNMAVVPEPSQGLLLALGTLSVAFVRRRRRA